MVVGRVFGQHAWRVGDGDTPRQGGFNVDIVDAGAELGDQLQLRTGLCQQAAVDPVGDGWHQNVGLAHGGGQLRRAHGIVGRVEPDIEQF